MCITIDGQGRRKSDFIRISVLSSEGSEVRLAACGSGMLHTC